MAAAPTRTSTRWTRPRPLPWSGRPAASACWPTPRSDGYEVANDVIEAMAAASLTGLEVWHPDQAPAMRGRLRVLAAELGLVPTGGSDDHGALAAATSSAPKPPRRRTSTGSSPRPFFFFSLSLFFFSQSGP